MTDTDFRPARWTALLALGACALTLLSGVHAAHAYVMEHPTLAPGGITLQHLRPIHATCAFAWMFLGGVTVVQAYLRGVAAPDRRLCLRAKLQPVLWTIAGIGILATIVSGQFTGREYLGYPPWFSVLILVGWLLFAWEFFSRPKPGLRGRPVYLHMWSVGIVLFVITYLEAHLYLLDQVSDRPLRDLALQWKSYGVMVGSFNLLAYGSITFVAGRISGSDDYAHSKTAYALFFVGLLNTFTNYGHHTYHLPQTPWIHWISFIVSMLEIGILAKVMLDVLGLLRRSGDVNGSDIAPQFMRSATLWTCLMLALSLGIAVPPLNALIHGTHVVTAHVMGSMLGIDSMILWCAFAYLLRDQAPVRRGALCVRLLNVSLVLFWAAFLASGLASGWSRYAGASAPDFSTLHAWLPVVIVTAGSLLAACALWIVGTWVKRLLRPESGPGQA